METLKVRKFPGDKRRRIAPRLRVTCGCGCKRSIDIWMDYHSDGCIAIGNVFGSTEDWRKILLPLLKEARK